MYFCLLILLLCLCSVFAVVVAAPVVCLVVLWCVATCIVVRCHRCGVLCRALCAVVLRGVCMLGLLWCVLRCHGVLWVRHGRTTGIPATQFFLLPCTGIGPYIFL